MAGSTQGEIPSQLGKTAVVTGATGGLGYETALALAKAGAEVILTGRDDRKRQSAIEKISREVIGAKISYEHLDLASLASIADFAQRMGVRQSLDLLINNAGVMALPRRQTTADGFEMQFGTNYLGHFALTARLMPLLRRSSGPRVVSVSSLAHRTGFIDFGDLQGARVYSPWKAYGQSKLACLIFALELQRRSDAGGWNLTSNAAHPGFSRTNLFASGPGGLLSVATDFAAPLFGHSAADGARPILFAATSPQAKPGAYYGPGGIGELRGAPAPALIMPQARDAATAARLWDVSEKLTGTSFA
jgi:NAD(P)-dependent dehydrogenase (short-subunit alcohol dehydrogenase family)